MERQYAKFVNPEPKLEPCNNYSERQFSSNMQCEKETMSSRTEDCTLYHACFGKQEITSQKKK